MSERLSDKLAKDWTDEIPDEEESLPEPLCRGLQPHSLLLQQFCFRKLHPKDLHILLLSFLLR